MIARVAKPRRRWPWGSTVSYVVLVWAAVLILFPLAVMVLSLFKTTGEILFTPLALPNDVANLWHNLQSVWSRTNFMLYLRNSALVTTGTVALVLTCGCMASYALARFPFRINTGVYLLFVIGLSLPIRLGILPLFILVRNLGIFDTHLALVLVYTAVGLPFAVLVLTGFMKGIPSDLLDAARIDGCSELRILWSIILPISRPALATVSIYTLILSWNDFFFPLILTRSEDVRTLPLGMSMFFGEYETNWALLFTGLTLASLPIVLAYLLLTRQFIAGLTAGATKG